eukprot:4728097-Prymnesium_polylepis.1
MPRSSLSARRSPRGHPPLLARPDRPRRAVGRRAGGRVAARSQGTKTTAVLPRRGKRGSAGLAIP